MFGDFEPKLSDQSKASDMLFLGQHPARAAAAGPRQCGGIGFAGLDTMNLWIDIKKRDTLGTGIQ